MNKRLAITVGIAVVVLAAVVVTVLLLTRGGGLGKGDFALTASSVQGKPGDILDYPVTMANNPGIWSFQFDVSYDADALELMDYTVGNVLDLGIDPEYITNNPIRFYFENKELANANGNGTVLTLHFMVKEDAASGVYDIRLKNLDAVNFDEQHVKLGAAKGTITVAK
jgi:hypothetical protein